MLRAALFILMFAFLNPGSAKASFEEGYKAYTEQKWQIAIIHLRPMVEAGDAKSMVVLGNMYLDGLGVAQDSREAFSLYRKAAIRDNPDAMVVVAALYQAGNGVRKNMRYAAEWYRRAARLGHGSGAFFYGALLYSGNRSAPSDNDKVNELRPDHEASYKWLRIAAKRTSNEKLARRATKSADNLAKKLKAERVAEIDAEIKEWVPEIPATLGPLPEDLPVPVYIDTPVAPEKTEEPPQQAPAPQPSVPAPWEAAP